MEVVPYQRWPLEYTADFLDVRDGNLRRNDFRPRPEDIDSLIQKLTDSFEVLVSPQLSLAHASTIRGWAEQKTESRHTFLQP